MSFNSKKEDKWRIHEVFEIIAFLVLGIVTLIIIPIFFGFAGGGFSENFQSGKPLAFGDIITTLLIYYLMAIPSLGIVIFQIGKIFYLKSKETIVEKVKTSWVAIFCYSVIHNPREEGALYILFDRLHIKVFGTNPMSWSINFFRVFIIGLLIFAPISLYQAKTGNSVVDIPRQSFFQQLSPTGNVYYQTMIPAFAETFLILFLFSLLMGVLGYLISKLKFSNNVKLFIFYFLALLVISPLVGYLWMQLHTQVYGNSDVKSFSTFIFATVGTAITVITGSAIWFYIWHVTNNLFLAIVQYSFGNEDVIFLSIVSIFILLIAWISVELLAYRWRKNHRKKFEDFEYE